MATVTSGPMVYVFTNVIFYSENKELYFCYFDLEVGSFNFVLICGFRMNRLPLCCNELLLLSVCSYIHQNMRPITSSSLYLNVPANNVIYIPYWEEQGRRKAWLFLLYFFFFKKKRKKRKKPGKARGGKSLTTMND